MAIINCPECDASISEKAVRCPHCGWEPREHAHRDDRARRRPVPHRRRAIRHKEHVDRSGASPRGESRSSPAALLLVITMLVLLALVIWPNIPEVRESVASIVAPSQAPDRKENAQQSSTPPRSQQSDQSNRFTPVMAPPSSPVMSNQDKMAAEKAARRNSIRVETATSLGSGFIMSRHGQLVLMVTNAHVVQGIPIGGEMTVKNEAGKAVTANLFWTDYNRTDRDFAILCANDRLGRLGDPVQVTDQISEGDWVVAVGNPLGENFYVSHGRVRGLSGTFIDHDAVTERGNSGGGLFNAKGQLIGVNTYLMPSANRQVEELGRSIRIAGYMNGFTTHSITVNANQDWTDTGISLAAGDRIIYAGSGRWTLGLFVGESEACGVRGLEKYRQFRDLPFGAMIAQIGTSGTTFGTFNQAQASSPGMLRLGPNDNKVSDNKGSISALVLIQRQ